MRKVFLFTLLSLPLFVNACGAPHESIGTHSQATLVCPPGRLAMPVGLIGTWTGVAKHIRKPKWDHQTELVLRAGCSTNTATYTYHNHEGEVCTSTLKLISVAGTTTKTYTFEDTATSSGCVDGTVTLKHYTSGALAGNSFFNWSGPGGRTSGFLSK